MSEVEAKADVKVKAVKKATSEKTKKTSWFKGLKAEFKKIIWPDKKTLAKQTVAVTVCSIILGVIIAVIDQIIKFGIDKLVR